MIGMAARRGARGARTVRATAAAVGPGGGEGDGWIGRGHTNTRQSPDILDIVSVTNRVYMIAQDETRQSFCMELRFASFRCFQKEVKTRNVDIY